MTCSLFKWTVPCAGGPGERGGGGGSELHSSNSLTECVVRPTPHGACNELANPPVTGGKFDCFSPLLPVSASPLSELGLFDKHMSNTHRCSHIPSHPFSHTHSLSLCPSHPLFFIPLYIHLFVLGKLAPTKGRGLAQGVQGGNIPTLRANLEEDRVRTV